MRAPPSRPSRSMSKQNCYCVLQGQGKNKIFPVVGRLSQGQCEDKALFPKVAVLLEMSQRYSVKKLVNTGVTICGTG